MFFRQFTRLDVILLLLCVAPMFVLLGAGEVQSWDESLFALRARAVLDYGDAFWNQEPYAAGGLYSATYPPLSVWGISACMLLFGEGEFSLRLFSALCGTASVFLLFALVRAHLGPGIRAGNGGSSGPDSAWISRMSAYAAATLLCGSLSWHIYSRYGMSDVPMVTCFLGALWTGLTLMQAQNSAAIRRAAILFGLWFCAALMTKIVVSLLPLLFALVLWFVAGARAAEPAELRLRSLRRRGLLFASLGALLLAAPWYIDMLISYGPEFYEAMAPPHLYKQAEGGPAMSAWWYYANRLLVDCPLLLGGLVMFARTLGRRPGATNDASKSGSGASNLLWVCAVWFVSYFLVFTLAQTRMPHYVLPMLPPLLIGVAAFMATILQNNYKPTVIDRLTLAAVPLTLLWSMTSSGRAALRSGSWFEMASPFIWALPLLVVAYLLWRGAQLPRFAGRVTVILTFAAAMLLIGRALVYNLQSEARLTNGAAASAQLLEQQQTDSLLVLTHVRNRGDWLVPQLAWYTQGWALNRRPGKYARVIGMQEWAFDSRVVNQADTIHPGAHIAYHFSPAYGAAVDSTRAFLAQSRPVLLRQKHYIIFGPAASRRSQVLAPRSSSPTADSPAAPNNNPQSLANEDSSAVAPEL